MNQEIRSRGMEYKVEVEDEVDVEVACDCYVYQECSRQKLSARLG